MTEFLSIEGGRIAYDIEGEGPLLVLMQGLGDVRAAYRFMVPELIAAGYRVANADLRGHGESSVGWNSYSRTDIADDLTALIRHLGGPVTIIGASCSGAAAAIVAAKTPELVNGIVLIDPGTLAPAFGLSPRFIAGMVLLASGMGFKSVGMYFRYLNFAYPTVKPADYPEYTATLKANLQEPGRMDAAAKAAFSSPADAQAHLPNIKCPALVVFGTKDPDFPNPSREAERVVAAMPAGLGTPVLIEGAGHYPHAQYPNEVLAAVLPFLARVRTT